jgi:hypothetical protein
MALTIATVLGALFAILLQLVKMALLIAQIGAFGAVLIMTALAIVTEA